MIENDYTRHEKHSFQITEPSLIEYIKSFDKKTESAAFNHPDPKLFFIDGKPILVYRWQDKVSQVNIDYLHFLDLGGRKDKQSNEVVYKIPNGVFLIHINTESKKMIYIEESK